MHLRKQKKTNIALRVFLIATGKMQHILQQPTAEDCDTVLCYPKGCAAPGNVRCQCNTREVLSKLKDTSPQRKIDVTSKSPVGDISVVTLIRTDTTLDHSQKAEKVWRDIGGVFKFEFLLFI